MRDLKGLPRFYVVTRSIMRTNKFIDGHTLTLLAVIALATLTTCWATGPEPAQIVQVSNAED